MVYDTGKIFVNSIGRKIDKFKRYSIRSCCFVGIDWLNLIILFISSLEVNQNLRSLVKHFFMGAILGRFCKFRRSFFFNCGSILTFGIRIANSGDSLSRNGLYNVYIAVIKSTCFFWVVLKDYAFIKVMPSLVMIPLLVKRVWAALQND